VSVSQNQSALIRAKSSNRVLSLILIQFPASH
jgi:hypothetical protein